MSQLPKALSRLRQAKASVRGSFGDCGILPGHAHLSNSFERLGAFEQERLNESIMRAIEGVCGILNIGSDAQIKQELLPLLKSAGLMAADSLYRTSAVVYMVALAMSIVKENSATFCSVSPLLNAPLVGLFLYW